ncbi:LCP family protein [Thermomicrobium sp. 4228-Ro]|uniref:LCP family protein n=1 Tax=Thermomicrobium sp. 4228-Ro TaxID=2993937 RepID=UPI0022499B90|nr:LCP family protein [Thermomicrobium sp. 4228-Ro]MCX2726315.1 LCP family protein [Thermomicrobium sp. 4228-Ro]
MTSNEPPREPLHLPYVRRTARELRAARHGYVAEEPQSPPVQPAGRQRGPSARVLIGIACLVCVAVVLAYLGPLALASWRAYQRVFVTPAPRATVVINERGTPEVVLLTADDPALQLPDWEKKDRINVLLLGVDRREQEEIPRSDTIIVVTIDPLTKDVSMLSIPRDLLVTIPGYGEDKINAAYALGANSPITGPGLVRATIEYNFGIPIHYYAEVDFDGFVRIVDTLGGVVVDVPAPIKDDEYPGEDYNYTRVYFAPGLQRMDGRTALRYVRTRHDDNDFSRGYRQQQVLRALREQGLRLDLIRKAPQLVDSLADTVRTDLSPTQVLALAKLGAEIPRDRIHSYTLLEVTTSYWEPGQPFYLIPNWSAIQAILDRMFPPREGQPHPQVRATSISIPAQPAAPELAEPVETPPPELTAPEEGTPEPTPEPVIQPTPVSEPTIAIPTATPPTPAATPTVAQPPAPTQEPTPEESIPIVTPTPVLEVTPSPGHG